MRLWCHSLLRRRSQHSTAAAKKKNGASREDEAKRRRGQRPPAAWMERGESQSAQKSLQQLRVQYTNPQGETKNPRKSRAKTSFEATSTRSRISEGISSSDAQAGFEHRTSWCVNVFISERERVSFQGLRESARARLGGTSIGPNAPPHPGFRASRPF